MAGKGGKGTGDDPDHDHALPDPQLARDLIRQQWEFASVLNFLHVVFEPLISNNLKLSAEEIETALVKPNQDLAKLHIALLKGIPPIAKNMSDSDAWITVLCKKLSLWWLWVAEGDNPLKADHGKEIERYNELDPCTRVLILKALCEVRAIQDDFLRYITDEMKKGTTITTFRKEKIGSNEDGITYWYDGDPVIGHRLYKETVKVELKQKPKGKGRATEPTIRYQWQTLATDLEEFREISDNLSTSKTKAEAAVGEMIKAEIIPILEELEKKKEQAWKRKQRQGQQLNDFLSSNGNGVGITRSRRERRPVCYTFDDYDRSIEEAIEISKKLKTTGSLKENVEQVKHISIQNGATSEGSNNSDTGNSNQDKDDGSLLEIKENDEQQSQGDEGDDDYDENDDYDEGNDEDESDHEDPGASDEEMGDPPRRTCSRNHKQKDTKSKAVGGLRRSQRLVEPSNGRAEMKERLRNTTTSSESEDSSSNSEEKQTEMVSDTTETPNASDDELQADSAGDE